MTTFVPVEPDCVPCPPELVQAWPQQVNLCIYEGDDFFLDLALTVASGAAYDLSGFTAQAQVRPEPLSDIVLADFDTSITNNVIHLHLTSEQNRGMAAGALVQEGFLVSGLAWDAQITNAVGWVTTLLFGRITVMHEVTRSVIA